MKQLLLCGNSVTKSLPTTASATNVAAPMGNVNIVAFKSTANENTVQLKMRSSGIVTGIFLYMDSNSRVSTTTWSPRINGSNVSPSISVGSGLTGLFQSASGQATFSPGDLLSIRVTNGSGTASHSVRYVGLVIVPKTLVSQYQLLVDQGFNISGANHSPLFSNSAVSSVAQAQTPIYNTQIFSNLRVLVTNNVRVNTTTVSLEKNGSATALSVSIPSGSTGEFEDTSNTVSFSPGDLISQALTFGAGIDNMVLGTQCTSNSPYFIQGSSSPFGTTAFPAGTSSFMPLCGETEYDVTSTETPDSVPMSFNGIADRMYVYVRLNSLDVTTTVKLRKNGADGNNSISISAGATGAFEDTTNTDYFKSGDLLSFEITIPAGTGTITPQQTVMRFLQTTTSPQIIIY